MVPSSACRAPAPQRLFRGVTIMSAGSAALSIAPSPQSLSAAQLVRAAAEGVPVRAIARIFCLDYTRVAGTLSRAMDLGQLANLPRPDWTPGSTTPSNSPQMLPADLEFLCRETFRLTNLEAAFLSMLLRCLFAEKEKLHAVVERQRYQRPLRPLEPEITDPKMVDVMICKLRRKLRAVDDKFIIRTSWGKGYFLEQAMKTAIMRRLGVAIR